MNNTFPILVDLDGVLRAGKNPCEGIKEFLGFIDSNKLDTLILSNTTQSGASELYEYFEAFNIKINIPIFTAADASVNYVKANFSKAAVYAMPKVKELFKGMLDYNEPDVVVMGDLGKEWNFTVLNEIFRIVHAGVPLVAMQKNRFWKTPEKGLLLDLGAFVKSIEFAADTNAVLIGKPSELYFKEGLKKINRNPGEKFLMIGDDYNNDILPVMNMGSKACLIYTGKTDFPLKPEILPRPDYEAKNLFEVIEILKNYL